MTKASTQRSHIFISYKRNVEPDESVALKIFDALSQDHDIFFDQIMLVGTTWAQRIEAELRRSDFLISLLSAESVHSEMVLGEIETAHRLAQEQSGRPAILPVRLAYREHFQYPLSAYLNPINWSFWKGHEDTPRLIEELLRAISGGTLSIDEPSRADITYSSAPPPLPQPLHSASVEIPGGAIDPQSSFYVERPEDRDAQQAIERQGVTITIKGPRQMGKSSLLIRTIDTAAKMGKRVAFLDFQLCDKSALANADIFFRQFCTWLTYELEIEDRTDDYWNTSPGNILRCTRYVERYLLKELSGPVVLAMDEVESIFDTDFRTDFFGMLRSWHDSRRAGSIWKQLDLALVTSTEPYQLIKDLNRSPFNVGEVIDLTDFTPEQVEDLNRRHGSPLGQGQSDQLMLLLNGHPYLVRRALYLVASGRISSDELFSQATEDRGPFGDHLRYHLYRIHDIEDLIQGMRQVIRHNTCRDEMIFFRLRGAGLVRREGRAVVPRCQLYADFLRERLNV